jgi:hypothetical protein
MGFNYTNLASFNTLRTRFWSANTSAAAFFPASTPANEVEKHECQQDYPSF